MRCSHPVPPLENGVKALVAGVNAAVAAGGYDLLFAGDDAELLVLSQARDLLNVEFPYPPHSAILRAVDKLTLTRLAGEVGIAVPTTEEADEAALRRVTLPVVVKPALHWTPGRRPPGRHLPMRLCRDGSEVRSVVEQIVAAGGRALLQQPVDGQLMALTVVTGSGGRLLAAVQQRTSVLTLRGTSARAETVPVDPDLQRKVSDLLAALDWTGLANIQFLRPTGGDPHLIDFNARFYGSMALARAAGVNVPAIWGGTTLGDVPAPMPTVGRPGLRYQALEEDLQRARVQRRGGLVRDLAGSLTYGLRATHTAWHLTDPMPGLVSAARLARSAVHLGSGPGHRRSR